MHLVHSQNDHFAAFPISAQAAGRTFSTAGFVPVSSVPSFFSVFFLRAGAHAAFVSFLFITGLLLPFFLIPFSSTNDLGPLSENITKRGIIYLHSYESNTPTHLDRLAASLNSINTNRYLNNTPFEFYNISNYFSIFILFNINKLKSNLIAFDIILIK